jgi:hypothetical protein
MRKILAIVFFTITAFSAAKAFYVTAEGVVMRNGSVASSEKVYITLHQKFPFEQTITDSVWTDVLGRYLTRIESNDISSRGSYTVHWTDCLGRIQSETKNYSVAYGKNLNKDFSCNEGGFIDINIKTEFIHYDAPNQEYLIEVEAPEYTFTKSGFTDNNGYAAHHVLLPSISNGNVKITWLYNCGGESMVENFAYTSSQNRNIQADFRCLPENSRYVSFRGSFTENDALVGFENFRIQLFDTMGYKHVDYNGRTFNHPDLKGTYSYSAGVYQEFVGEIKYTWYNPCDGNTRIITEPVDFRPYEGYHQHERSFICNDFNQSNTTVSVSVSGFVKADEVRQANYEVVIRAVDDNQTTFITDTITSDSNGNYTHQFTIHDNFIGRIYADWFDPCINEKSSEEFYTSNIQADNNITINLDCEVGNPNLTTGVTISGAVKVNSVGKPGEFVRIWVENLNGEKVYEAQLLTLQRGKYNHVFQLPKYFDGNIYSEWNNYCSGIDENQSSNANNLRYGASYFVHNYDCKFGTTGIISGNVWGSRNGLSEYVTDTDVFLYQQDLSTGLFNKVDSFYIDPATDSPGRYQLEVTYGEKYIVKAVAHSNPENIPTYHEEAATWQEAKIIDPLPGLGGTNYYIVLLNVGSQSGSKTIKGNYNDHANLHGTHAVLTNKNTKDRYVAPLDGNGNYEFTKLPHGDYHILLDITDFDVVPLDVSLDDNKSSNTTINFEYLANKNGVVASLSQDQLLDFTLAPNPVSSLVTIKLNESSNGTLTIQDAYGRTLKEVTLIDKQELSLDVNEFSAGIYIVTVNSDNKSFNKRFVKQ